MLFTLRINRKNSIYFSFYLTLQCISIIGGEHPIVIIPSSPFPLFMKDTGYKPIKLDTSKKNHIKREILKIYVTSPLSQDDVSLLSQDDLSLPNLLGITIPHIQEPGERLGACIDYALRSIFKITKESSAELKLPRGQHFLNDLNVLKKYFKQTAHPKVGSLAVSASKEGNYFHNKHYAVVIETNPIKIRSKNAISRLIVDGPLDLILPEYGDYFFFFKLKDKYKNNINSLHRKLKSSIQQTSQIQKDIALSENIVLQIAQGNYVLSDNLYDFLIKTPINVDPHGSIIKNLEKFIGANVNTRTKNRETPLMLAAKRGDLHLVKLFIQYGAAPELKNNNNETALMLAEKNSHTDTVDFLQEHQNNPKKEYYSDEVYSATRPLVDRTYGRVQTLNTILKATTLGSIIVCVIAAAKLIRA